MKSEFFLALPVLATTLNVLFATVLIGLHTHGGGIGSGGGSGGNVVPVAHSQPNIQPIVAPPVVRHEAAAASNDRCIAAGGTGPLGSDEECLFNMASTKTAEPTDNDEQEAVEAVVVDDDDERSKVERMPEPDSDFEAYVRRDVSTFYRQRHEPVNGNGGERTPSFTGQACKFVNMSPHAVTQYWVSGNEDKGNVFQGSVGPWEATGTSCFPGHVFIFTSPLNEGEELVRFTIQGGIKVYYYDPYIADDVENPAQGVTNNPSPFDAETTLNEEDLAKYRAHVYNLGFAVRYKNFTRGTEWLQMYPRDPPRHKMWSANYIGEQRAVSTRQTQFVQEPPADQLRALSTYEMKNVGTQANVPLSEYRQQQANGVLNLTLTTVSVAPRVFSIEHFLSDAEVEHLLNVVQQQKKLERSTTSGRLSDTRTSRTTWIPRHTDLMLDAIFRRVGDCLRINEVYLRHRVPGEIPADELPGIAPINEDMQIVHYNVGQEYTAHHDFGYRTQLKYPEAPSRFINLALYLNDVPAGGKTAFPQYRSAETSDGLKVTPQKGKAIIFYMIHPDGNVDDLTQHAAEPVLEGEKYFANLWIWDPFRV